MKTITILKILGSVLLLIILFNCLRIGWIVCQCKWGWGLGDHQSYTNDSSTILEADDEWLGDLPDVTVGKIKTNILPKEKTLFFGIYRASELGDGRLWEIMRKARNIEKFNEVTTENWQENYTKLSSLLVHKAQALGLNAQSLSRCLDSTYNSSDTVARLPVAAFTVYYDKRKTWVVCYVWEYADVTDTDGNPLKLVHVSAYLFDEESYEVIELVTCG